MCVNHPKILTFQKLSSPLHLFCLKSFNGFLIVRGRMEPITCLRYSLVQKMWRIFYRKPYRTWQTTVKTLKKHQYVHTGTYTKTQILINRFVDE